MPVSFPVRAGDLNRRITIQQRSTDVDAAGQPVSTWTTFATLWANVAAPTGLGAISDMQGNLEASVTHVSIRIRYRTDITPDMRLLMDGGVFDIKMILPDYGSKYYTDLVCTAGGSNG